MSKQTKASTEPALNITDVPVLGSWTASTALPWTTAAAAMQQVQSAGFDAWRSLQHDIEINADEVGHASTPQEILEWQTQFAMVEAAQCLRMLEQCWAAAFDIQSLWVRQADRWTVELLQSWVDKDVSGLAVPYPEPPDDPTPLGMLSWSQNAWIDLGSVWLGALKHDLENEPAPAVAPA